MQLYSYRNFGLAERRWHVQVLGYQDVPEVVVVGDAPHGQPVDVVDGDVLWQLDLDVLALVSLERVQPAGRYRRRGVKIARRSCFVEDVVEDTAMMPS